VLALNPGMTAPVYDRLFATIDRPTIVIENKTMYGEWVSHQTIAGFWAEHTHEDSPRRAFVPYQPDVTLVCYGGTLHEAERAADKLFEEHEVIAEIVCPIQIYPLNYRPIVDSVKRSGRLLVVEEGQAFCGFGAEVVSAYIRRLRNSGDRPQDWGQAASAGFEQGCGAGQPAGADTIVAGVVEMMRQN